MFALIKTKGRAPQACRSNGHGKETVERKLTVETSKDDELGDERELEGGLANLQERVSSFLEKKLNWKLDSVLKILQHSIKVNQA